MTRGGGDERMRRVKEKRRGGGNEGRRAGGKKRMRGRGDDRMRGRVNERTRGLVNEGRKGRDDHLHCASRHHYAHARQHVTIAPVLEASPVTLHCPCCVHLHPSHITCHPAATTGTALDIAPHRHGAWHGVPVRPITEWHSPCPRSHTQLRSLQHPPCSREGLHL